MKPASLVRFSATWGALLLALQLVCPGCSSEENEQLQTALEGLERPTDAQKALQYAEFPQDVLAIVQPSDTGVELDVLVHTTNALSMIFHARQGIIAAGEGLSSRKQRGAPAASFQFETGAKEARADLFLTPETRKATLWLLLESGQLVEAIFNFTAGPDFTPAVTLWSALSCPDTEIAEKLRPLFGEIHRYAEGDKNAPRPEGSSDQPPSILPVHEKWGVLCDIVRALPTEQTRYSREGPQVLARMQTKTHTHRDPGGTSLVTIQTIRPRSGRVLSTETKIVDRAPSTTATRNHAWHIQDLTFPLARSIGSKSGEKALTLINGLPEELKEKGYRGPALDAPANAALLLDTVDAYWLEKKRDRTPATMPVFFQRTQANEEAMRTLLDNNYGVLAEINRGRSDQRQLELPADDN